MLRHNSWHIRPVRFTRLEQGEEVMSEGGGGYGYGDDLSVRAMHQDRSTEQSCLQLASPDSPSSAASCKC
jgi:hypothetical protein